MNDFTPKVQEQNQSSNIHVIGYGADDIFEAFDSSTSELAQFKDKFSVLWINVDGGLTPELMEKFGELFSIHELALEDILNFKQRPKTEDYESYLFIVTRMMCEKAALDSEQLSIILGSNYVLTFQEKSGGDCLNVVRDRLRKNAGKVRKLGPDYLAYLLIDAVVDSYFPILETIGERVELLEDEIMENKVRSAPARIHELKRDTLGIRRTIWPLRDAIYSLCRDSHPLITDYSRVYLRDCYDHTLRIIDLIEMFREIGHDLMDIYLSTVNNRMNEVMKVLTIITSLFIPPTFIAGIYGMNFNPAKSPWNMPELEWYFGYPLALIVMLALAGGMIVYLRHRGWLGNES